jgi:hypothetical protein
MMKQLITIFAFLLLGLMVNAQYIYNDFDANQNDPFSGWPNMPTIIANPDASGVNTSANVAEFVRSEEQWAHTFCDLEGTIDFSTGTVFEIKVYMPIAANVLFKLEGDGGLFTELGSDVSAVNEWTQLSFDFAGAQSGVYNKIVIFFDIASGVNNTYYFDDVQGPEYGGGASGDPVELPVTFDDEDVIYGLTDFGGNVSSIIVDPTNASNMVAQSIKTAGSEPWAGTTIGGSVGFPEPIPFAEGATFMNVRVWSPTAGIPIRLKVEDSGDPTISVETEAITTVASDWQTLLFDFSNEAPGTAEINFGYSYNKASIFFNFDTPGTDETYYWDDVEFGPLTFVKENNVQQLTFLQNPVQDILRLDNDQNIQVVYAYELSGRTLELNKSSDSSYDVSELKTGVYTVLAIDKEGNKLVGKILKK